MCGRYASGRDPADLAVVFGAVPDDAAEARSSWNIAPTDTVYAVLERSDGSKLDAAPVRRLRPVRWGLVPSWAANARGAARMINARLETAAQKPAFRKAFAARRCLLPADGWYEWQPGHGRAKTPHFIRPRHGGVLAFAGLYELWHDPARPREDPASWLWTATILTTATPPELRHLHHRMPIVVDPARYDTWLDPALRDPDAVPALLPPIRPNLLEAHPVDPAVGNVANDGPHLTRPRLPDAEPALPVGQTTPDGS
jgi:putative SOS response-associated peptidase YedK